MTQPKGATTETENTYDPTAHLTKLQGRAYLGARERLRWLRSDHPLWTINTGIVELDFTGGYAVIFAEVLDDAGRLIARAMKQEERQHFTDFVEKAETGAIGRACAVAGYGTEDAADLDEGTVSDSPVISGGREASSARPAAPIAPTNGHRAGAPPSPGPAARAPEPPPLFDEPEFKPIGGESPADVPTDVCPIHGTRWIGEPGDQYHGPKGVVPTGYCRHPANVKRPAAARR